MMNSFEHPISDKLIWEKMVKHRGCRGDECRDLIKVKVPNGYGDKGENHTIYALQGSPIKAFAVRRSNKLHMYEQSGKRWATYGLCTTGSGAIIDDVSKSHNQIFEEVNSNE